MRPERRNTAIGIGWAGLVVLIWSAWFAVTRFSLTRTLGAPDLVAMRIGIGGLVLLPLLWARRHGIPRRAWAEAALLSACWGAPFLLLVSEGIRLTSASNAAALTPSTMPVFAGLFAWVALGQRPSRMRLLGYAIILGGVTALLAASGGAQAGRGRMLGDAALLTGAATWAVYTVRVRNSGLTAVPAAALVCLYSAVVYVPVYFLAGWSHLGQAPAAELTFQAIYQGVFVGGLSVVGFNQAIARLGAPAAAAIASLVPVATTLLAIPLLGEFPTPCGAIAIAAIAAGVFLVARVPPPAASRGDPVADDPLPEKPDCQTSIEGVPLRYSIGVPRRVRKRQAIE